MKRLTECKCRSENGNCLMIGGFCTSIPQNYCDMAKRLKQYKDLEEQGKLLKLPCAVGDTVYEVDKAILSDERIEPIECKVEHITVFKTNIYFSVTVIKGHGSGSTYEFELKDFGKTVFLTKEEAEAALKEL